MKTIQFNNEEFDFMKIALESRILEVNNILEFEENKDERYEWSIELNGMYNLILNKF